MYHQLKHRKTELIPVVHPQQQTSRKTLGQDAGNTPRMRLLLIRTIFDVAPPTVVLLSSPHSTLHRLPSSSQTLTARFVTECIRQSVLQRALFAAQRVQHQLFLQHRLLQLLQLRLQQRHALVLRPLPLLRLLRKAAFPTAQSSLPPFRQPLPRQAVRMHLRSAFFPSRSCKNILRKVNKKYEKVSCERQRLPL